MQQSRDTPTWGYSIGRGDPVVFVVRGEIDLATAPELGDALVELVDEGHLNVSLDLSAVQFLDSTGLHVLSKARARLEEAGGRLVLSAASRPVRIALQRSGVDRLLVVPKNEV